MFTILWGDEPFARLGQIVQLNPARKDELAHALREITGRLQANPTATGESRGGDLRVLIATPLTVYFRPDDDTATVRVVGVRVRFLT